MKAQKWAALGAAVATVLLTAAAFWLSYEHLHDVAGGNGLSGVRAWAWPATVDLFIVIGELLMLRASLTGRGADWWAVALVVTGSGGSIALNVAGVGGNAPVLAYIVAAVPPVAALLAFGALMRQLHDHLANPYTQDDVPLEVYTEPATLDVIQGSPPATEPLVICGAGKVYALDASPGDEPGEVVGRLDAERARLLIEYAWTAGLSTREAARVSTRSPSYAAKVYARLDEENDSPSESAQLELVSAGVTA